MAGARSKPHSHINWIQNPETNDPTHATLNIRAQAKTPCESATNSLSRGCRRSQAPQSRARTAVRLPPVYTLGLKVQGLGRSFKALRVTLGGSRIAILDVCFELNYYCSRKVHGIRDIYSCNWVLGLFTKHPQEERRYLFRPLYNVVALRVCFRLRLLAW